MPLPALLLLIATLAPLVVFGVLVFYGRKMGTPFAGFVGIAGVAVSYVCSLFAMIAWIGGGDGWGMENLPINLPINWLPVGTWASQSAASSGYLTVGLYVDSLTIVMFNMITLVATLIFIFSVGYMRDDSRFPRFFTYLSLFTFSMLGLVLGGTLLQLFIFWELVGLCSYLLIGFWYEKKTASNAAIKAFVVNRIGDFGFLIGFGILFYHVGNAALPDLWAQLGPASSGAAVTLKSGTVFSPTLLTLMGVGLFFGAVGKSAQFPLHVWLPDAMEGPTPVSAMVHAATMVAAGVYLVARVFYILTPDVRLFIAIIGCVTLTMAALIAMVQSDIKRVLAYSTLSQLGYMILAMGVGSWVGGLFHLITHAFFKSLLFLGAGSVIQAAHHEQEMGEYGGLIRRLPVTAITFGVAVLAISGFNILGIGISGYYSKDMIIAHAGALGWTAESAGRSSWYWLLFLLPVVVAYITPFYMMRCWMLTFWGRPRNEQLHQNAREEPMMYIPLLVLAFMSVISGWADFGIKDLLNAAIKETTTFSARIDPAFSASNNIWPSDPPGRDRPELDLDEAAAALTLSPSQLAHQKGEHSTHEALTFGWSWLIGIGLAFLIYMNGLKVGRGLVRIPPLGWIHAWLYRGMYFNEFYYSVFVNMTLAFSVLSAWFDKYVVDGIVNFSAWIVRKAAIGVGAHDKYVIDGAVNGVASLSQQLGAAVRTPQTGRIRVYVTALVAAVTIGLAGAIVVVMSR